jgi:hypothetical protein
MIGIVDRIREKNRDLDRKVLFKYLVTFNFPLLSLKYLSLIIYIKKSLELEYSYIGIVNLKKNGIFRE